MFVRYVLRRRVAPGDTGIVDQDVDCAMPRFDFLGDDVDTRRIRHVHIDDFDGKARRLHCRPTFGGYLCITVGYDDPSAGLGKRLDASEPDCLATTCHESETAVEVIFVKIHRARPYVALWRAV